MSPGPRLRTSARSVPSRTSPGRPRARWGPCLPDVRLPRPAAGQCAHNGKIQPAPPHPPFAQVHGARRVDPADGQGVPAPQLHERRPPPSRRRHPEAHDQLVRLDPGPVRPLDQVLDRHDPHTAGRRHLRRRPQRHQGRDRVRAGGGVRHVPAQRPPVPHLQRPDRSFHRGYDYYEWIRGQEIDNYGQAPRKLADFSELFPADYLNRPELTKQFARQRNSAFQLFLNQYLANRKRWLQDGESIVEITSKKAIRWLNENHDQGPVFLHVEAFDPHEPWDPPKQFLEQYLKSPGPHSWPEPPYSDTGVPKEGVERLRANYAGEASAVDHWFGQILATVDELGLTDNTVVVFLADHGALLGEQGQFVKGPERLRRQVTHIPLLIRTPDKRFAAQRVPGFLQVPDVAPTILGRLGLKAPARFTGVDVWPKAPGAAATDRDHVVIAYSWIASVRTHEWNYSAVWNKAKYKGDYPPQLYDLKADPDELHNVIDKHPDVARALHAKIDAYIASGQNLTNGTFHSQEA